MSTMTDTAPDFALPWRKGAEFKDVVFNSDYTILITCPNEVIADLIVSAVNNAAARDAEIARLREALKTFAEFFDWAKKYDWPEAVASDDGTPIMGSDPFSSDRPGLQLYVRDFRNARADLSSIPTASDTDEVTA